MSESDVWPQLVFEASADMVPELEDVLFAAGALSIILTDNHDQPVLEPAPGEVRLWDSLRVTGLFTRSDSADDILARCTELYPRPLPQHRFENLPDEDWERSWMAHFKAMPFGEHLWIYPSHIDVPDTDAHVIRLDPGLAFGSGTHPTTALCLQWLSGCCVAGSDTPAQRSEASSQRLPLAGKCVMDFGCGSGILAIAAAKMGAKKVIAVDIDPQALLATRVNARENNVSECVQTMLPADVPAALQAEGLQHVDLLLANILFNPLLALVDEFAALLRPHGELVVSGLLEDQVEPLMLHYTQYFLPEKTRLLDGWALVQASRLPPPSDSEPDRNG